MTSSKTKDPAAKITKVITIDGPAGAGKSTIAQLVAKKLGWSYVTTGAIYRCFAYILHINKWLPENPGAHFEFQFQPQYHDVIDAITENFHMGAQGGVFLGTQDVTEKIRDFAVSQWASVCAENATVRKLLLPLQRKIVLAANGAVVDGRDMGSVVFQDALLKIFLEATPEERARRRMLELQNSQSPFSFEEILQELRIRDERDRTRKTAPLVRAVDAIPLDSTDQTPENICEQICRHARDRKMVAPLKHPR